ncbi:MAG: hypothetical protein Q8K69_07795 [Bacteroidota bacterium]|nr:hypothetical protein [Bacteroidota bacterium]
MEQQLYELFVQNNGYVASNLIRGNRSLYYQLKTMLESGKVVQIKRGLYRHTDFKEDANLGEVCRIVPQGVLCLFTAWQFYSLSTHVSSFVHLSIPVRKKPVLPVFPPVKIYFWKDDYFKIGRIETTHNGQQISIYDLEKSVCDAIRYRNKVGTELSAEVLRNYLKRKDRNLDRLMKYAEDMRIAIVLNQYLSVML